MAYPPLVVSLFSRAKDQIDRDTKGGFSPRIATVACVFNKDQVEVQNYFGAPKMLQFNSSNGWDLLPSHFMTLYLCP